MVEDWVLIEAAKRADWYTATGEQLRSHYGNNTTFTALCDMIAKYEQPPVDPDVRLVADIVNAFEGLDWDKNDTALLYSENLDRAVAVYKADKA